MGKFSRRLVAAMPWLDTPGNAIKTIAEPILGPNGPRGVKDALYGVWLGHPLHPMVIVAPLGCWLTSVLCDLVGDDAAADLTLKLGTVSALGAAVTGVAQWQDTQELESPRRLGTLHALTNTAGLTCFTASWLCRSKGSRSTGQVLSLTGLGFAAAAGWLGGDLAYDLGIGVNHTAFEEPKDEWVDVAREENLTENQPQRVVVAGVPVMLLKQDGAIHAIAATCPHLGGPLDQGTISDHTVTCPWHGSVFDVTTGDLRHGPATFGCVPYDVRVKDGSIAIRPQSQ